MTGDYDDFIDYDEVLANQLFNRAHEFVKRMIELIGRPDLLSAPIPLGISEYISVHHQNIHPPFQESILLPKNSSNQQ